MLTRIKHSSACKGGVYDCQYKPQKYLNFPIERGNEFKKQMIAEMHGAFEMTCSLSHKGCLYDNTVAKATVKIFKT